MFCLEAQTKMMMMSKNERETHSRYRKHTNTPKRYVNVMREAQHNTIENKGARE